MKFKILIIIKRWLIVQNQLKARLKKQEKILFKSKIKKKMTKFNCNKNWKKLITKLKNKLKLFNTLV